MQLYRLFLLIFFLLWFRIYEDKEVERLEELEVVDGIKKVEFFRYNRVYEFSDYDNM